MVTPLYNESLEKLLEIVRIEPATDTNTIASIHQAVRDVRLGLFSRLGKTRALEIKSFILSDDPITDEEVTRATAASAEAMWLYILLIQRLPVLFMDNSASTGDLFNDEPLTRDASGAHTFINSLKKQLEETLQGIATDDSELNKSVKSTLNGPEKAYLLSQNNIGLT